MSLACTAAKGHVSILKALLSCPEVDPSSFEHLALRLALHHKHEDAAVLLLSHSRNALNLEAALEANRLNPPLLELNEAPFTQLALPGEFFCGSGELLWGALPYVYQAAANLDAPHALGPQKLPFRSAAKVGKWKVARVYSQTDAQSERQLSGYIAYHESADVSSYIVQAARKASDFDEELEFPNISSFDMMRWVRFSSLVVFSPSLQGTSHGQPFDLKSAIFGLDKIKADFHLAPLGSQRFVCFYPRLPNPNCAQLFPFIELLSLFMLDAADVFQFTNALRRCPVISDRAIRIGDTGVHIPAPRTSRSEMGWLCYSGGPHELFPDQGELVAFIYCESDDLFPLSLSR